MCHRKNWLAPEPDRRLRVAAESPTLPSLLAKRPRSALETRFTLAGQSFPEPSPYDRRILDSQMRYVGDEVAIVAAVDEMTALAAIGKIKVQYEVLPAVLDLMGALDNSTLVQPLCGTGRCGSRACSLRCRGRTDL